MVPRVMDHDWGKKDDLLCGLLLNTEELGNLNGKPQAFPAYYEGRKSDPLVTLTGKWTEERVLVKNGGGRDSAGCNSPPQAQAQRQVPCWRSRYLGVECLPAD